MFKYSFKSFYSNPKDRNIANQSIECRGTILHHMANLEIVINAYIGNFFCGESKEKIEQMILLILGDERMSLSSKAQVFYFIASNHDKDWYLSYKSIRVHPDSKKIYSMNNDLVYVIEERNNFAHRIRHGGFIKGNTFAKKHP